MRNIISFLLFFAIVGLSPTIEADEFDKKKAEKIIEDAENVMRGKASVGVMEMKVHNPRWERTMTMKFWEVVPDKMLVRVTAPAQDAGTGSLKLKNDLWSYNPHIDQIQKIPPSLMLDSWMGSDFTNDDITRESSTSDDYDAVAMKEKKREGETVYRITLKPKPESPVVWEKLIVEATKEGHRPVRHEFYDEKGNLARVMTLKKYKKLENGKMYPHVWRMENKQEKNRYTEMRVKELEFKEDLSNRIFSIRNLKRGRR